MPKSLVDAFEIPITCSDCRHEHKKSLAWLRKNTVLKCAGCGEELDLKPYDFPGMRESADEAVKGLQKNLGRIQKKLR